MNDPHILTMTAYPPGYGPYDRWEVTTPSGEVLISGTTFPVDNEAVTKAAQAYHRCIELGISPFMPPATPAQAAAAVVQQAETIRDEHEACKRRAYEFWIKLGRHPSN